MKQQLSEALAYVDSRSGAANSNEVDTIIAAARLVERLLPGVCEECEGSGSVLRRGEPFSGSIAPGPCATCRGSRRVWDEGMLDHIMEVASFRSRDTVIAILSALVELLTEKVKR